MGASVIWCFVKGSRAGQGVDAFGGAVVDPTENVKDLSRADVRRQDDLRTANNKLVKAELRHLKETAELRAAHTREMRESEAKRLDAIRQIDVAARTAEADRAIRAIDALATTTKNEADKIRGQLDTTAITLAKQTSEQFDGVNRRIAELERTSYKGEGTATGSKERSSSITAAIYLGIAIVSLILGSIILPLLQRKT